MTTSGSAADAQRRRLGGALVALTGLSAMGLAGCAAPGRTPDAAPAAPPTAAPGPQAGRPTALMLERQWLQSWFKGTPVQINQRGDGPVSVDVPLAFCFDPGRSQVKPALAAVLDKVAESLRRAPQTRLVRLAAPGDGAEADRLAGQRAARLRSHLLSRGAPSSQLVAPTTATAQAVQLVIDAMPAP